MTENIELKNSNGKNVQINCVRDFSFPENENDDYINYRVVAGEDGAIKIIYNDINTSTYHEEYLPYAIDSNGWLIEIDDAFLIECIEQKNYINKIYLFIVSPAGIIGIYTKKIILDLNSNDNNKGDWIYKILLENEECYYTILEAKIEKPRIGEATLYMKLFTEFSGIAEYTFSVTD